MYTRVSKPNVKIGKISDKTIDLHYDIYLEHLYKLNSLLKNQNFKFDISKKDLVDKIDMFDLNARGDILYHLGAVLNHEQYFFILGKNDESNELTNKIIEQYGSIKKFRDEIENTASYLVGSGYVFVVLNKDKKLEIVNFSNEETPYTYDLIPIIALDLYEHSYYLDYYFNKDLYIKDLVSNINFKNANEIYQKVR